MASAGKLHITADTLNNAPGDQNIGGLLYAAQEMQLDIEQILNNDQSVIVSGDSMRIQGQDLHMVNRAGEISAGKDLTITGQSLTNKAIDYDAKSGDDDNKFGYDIDPKVHKNDYQLDNIVILEQDEALPTLASISAYLGAVRDLWITMIGDVKNHSSQMVAGQDIHITADTLENTTHSLTTEPLSRRWGKQWRESYCAKKGLSGSCKSYAYRMRYTDWDEQYVDTVYSKDQAFINASGELNIEVTQLINGNNTKNPELGSDAEQAPTPPTDDTGDSYQEEIVPLSTEQKKSHSNDLESALLEEGLLPEALEADTLYLWLEGVDYFATDNEDLTPAQQADLLLNILLAQEALNPTLDENTESTNASLIQQALLDHNLVTTTQDITQADETPVGTNGNPGSGLPQLSSRSNEDVDMATLLNRLNNSGLFQPSLPDAQRRYVIETRHQFIDLSNFLGSDYFLSRPSAFYNPSVNTHDLVMGDAYWEHKYLEKQLLKQTQNPTLYGLEDGNALFERLFVQSESEFSHLQNQGVEIGFGIELSQAAIDALRQDIVWYVNTTVEIDGVTHTALVPRLYLANATLAQLSLEPKEFFAANQINIKAKESVINRGTIKADQLAVVAHNILNQGGEMSAKDAALYASNTLINESTTIQAEETLALGGGNVVNRASKTIQYHGDDQITTLGHSGLIKAGDLTISANNLINTASNIKADQVQIDANNVLISTQIQSTNLTEGAGDNYANTQSQTHQLSDIQVTGDLNIVADDISISGATISADNATLESNSLDISSVQDSKATQIKSTSSGGFFGGSSQATHDSQTTTIQGGELAIVNNLTLKNQRSQIIASKVKAKAIEVETAMLSLISQKSSDHLQETSDTSGLTKRKITDRGHQQETVQAALLQTQSLHLNGQSIVESLQPANLSNSLVKELSSQQVLTDQLKQAGIDLQSLSANNKAWDESITTLSAIGHIIVQLAVNSALPGAGADGSFIDVAMNSVTNQTAVALAQSAITGEPVHLDIETMLRVAVSAGASAYASDWVSANTQDALREAMTTGDYAKNAMIKGTIDGIKSEINGKEFKEGFATGAGVSVVSDGSLQMRKHVTKHYELGKKGSSAGMRGDGMRAAGSHRDPNGNPMDSPFGGSIQGDMTLFGHEIDPNGATAHMLINFSGPHDFLSSWNYENYKENGIDKTKLINDNWLIDAASGVLLLPSSPLATAPAIQDHADTIEQIKHRIEQDQRRMNQFKAGER